MGSWSLFEIWAACVLVVTPISIFQVLHERREAAKAKEAQSAKQRLAEWGKPENQEQKESELEWLSSMSMPQHMVATRLLVAHVDELGEADRTFLEQVRALPYEGRCRHVSTRRSICNGILRKLNGYEERQDSQESLLKCLVGTLAKTAVGAALLVGGGKLITMAAAGVSTLRYTQWDAEAWRQAGPQKRGKLVQPLILGDEAAKQGFVETPNYFTLEPPKFGEHPLPEDSHLWKLADKQGVIRELGEPDEDDWPLLADGIAYYFDTRTSSEFDTKPDSVLILMFDEETGALIYAMLDSNRRAPGVK